MFCLLAENFSRLRTSAAENVLEGSTKTSCVEKIGEWVQEKLTYLYVYVFNFFLYFQNLAPRSKIYYI